MRRKQMVTTLIGLAIFGALTGLLLEVMMEGDEAKFRQFAQKIKDNTLILFATAQMATVQNMISHATVGLELSTTQVDPDSTPNNGDEYFLNQVSECVFTSPDDIPFPTCLICQLSDQKCIPKIICPTCKKPNELTVAYDGPNPDSVIVEIYKNEGDVGKSDKLLLTTEVNGEGNIVIDSDDFLDKDGNPKPKDNLESQTTYLIIDGGQEIAVISFHTSCSQPEVLIIGNTFSDGDVTLTIVGGIDVFGNPAIPDPSCREQPGVIAEGEKILPDGYVAGTLETIPLPTGAAFPENDAQDVRCVVLLVCGQDCPECKKSKIFTVAYDGPEVEKINLYTKEMDVGDEDKVQLMPVVNTDGEIVVNNDDLVDPDPKGTLPNNLFYEIITVDGTEVIRIHVSCSDKPFFVGREYTEGDITLTIVFGIGEDGTPSIPDELCVDTSET